MSEIYKKFAPDKYEVHFKVEEDDNATRLDQFLQKFLVSFSRQQVKKKITKGEVIIRGRPHPHKASTKIYENEIIELFTLPGTLEDEYWNGQKLELQRSADVIFEDEQIVAINKPPYMVTHPTGKHLFNCATVFLEHKYEKTVHSIHRLDRETSGTLLLGKNPKGAQIYTDYFEKSLVKKCYFLIAHNTNPKENFTANERLGTKDDFIPRLFVHCFDEKSSYGKHAQTSFHTLFKNEKYILTLAFPKTGRQHQIRSHAAFHGFPLIGDKLYNGDPSIFMRFKDGIATPKDHDQMMLSRHALHALALKVPYKDTTKTFRSNLPEDFKEWIQQNFSQTIDVIESKIDAALKDLF